MSTEVSFLPEAVKFLNRLDTKTREKVFFNIKKTKEGMTGEWFRKMISTDDLWEFRTLYNNQCIRLFAFWDKADKREALIICTHGILKKTQKTPDQEITHAEELKKFYFKQKKIIL